MVDDNRTIIVKPPFTIRFSIRRHTGASVNTMDIDILNLDENTRNDIFQDRFFQNKLKRRSITIEAGYDTLSTIYQGTIYEASSTREGVNIVTSISSRDGGWETDNGFMYQTVKAPVDTKTLLQTLVGGYSTLKGNGLTLGAISDTFKDVILQRPVVLEGNIFDMLKKYSDGKVYIDLEKVYILQNNEVITGAIPLIDADTGLLSTPKRDETFMTITTLFEPRIVMGQSLDVYSTINKVYNGTYKVAGVQHMGTISEAVGGDLRTIIHMFNPQQLNGSIVNVG